MHNSISIYGCGVAVCVHDFYINSESVAFWGSVNYYMQIRRLVNRSSVMEVGELVNRSYVELHC